MGSDKTLIGKKYPAQTWTTASVDLAAFARATDDLHPRYTGPKAQLQPMAVVLATASLGIAQVVGDSALIGDSKRLLKLLHSAEDISWNRAINAGEAFIVRTTLTGIDTSAVGETLYITTDLHDVAAALDAPWVVRAKTALFIRERTRMPIRVKAEPLAESVAPAGKLYTEDWQVAPDQAERYAQASGDDNPIHLDDAVAKRAGLSGRVIHGLCTMAFAARAITKIFADGDPSRLRQLSLRFARPVYLGEMLTLTAERVDDGRIAFSVRNAAGRLVLDAGCAKVAPASAER